MTTSEQLADMVPLTATVLDGEVRKICMTRAELLALVNAASAPQVVADERAAFDSWWRGRVPERDDSLHAAEFAYSVWLAALAAAAPVQAQEPVGYVNLRYGTFFPPRTLAHTERNTKLIETGEIIRVYSAPVQPVAVPDGWKLVPVEPTDEMRMATIHSTYHYEIEADWAAMLAAAPAAPAAPGDAKELTDEEIDIIAMRECPERLQTAGSLRRLIRAAIAAKEAS